MFHLSGSVASRAAVFLGSRRQDRAVLLELCHSSAASRSVSMFPNKGQTTLKLYAQVGL
jgi:hypothetical protein